MAGTSEVIERSVTLPVGAEEAFAWHERPGALERLIPPWERVEVLERSGGITDGARVVVRLHEGPVAIRWVARHRDYQAGRRFVDDQVEGPFARWVHTHIVRAAGTDLVPAHRPDRAHPARGGGRTPRHPARPAAGRADAGLSP